MFSVTMNSQDRRIPSVATPRREKNSSMLEMSERRKSNARGWSCSTDWETSMMYRWLLCNLENMPGLVLHIRGKGGEGGETEDRVYLQNIVFTQIGMDEVAVLVHSSGRNDQFCVQIG